LQRYAAQQLDALGLGYLHVIEPRIAGSQVVEEGAAPVASRTLRKVFSGDKAESVAP
jgi:N-ethylmaleimide reductase